MTDYYQLPSYPQTSCTCGSCPNLPLTGVIKQNKNLSQDYPCAWCNLAMEYCKQTPESFNCTNTEVFNTSKQPQLPTPQGITRFNEFGEVPGEITYAKDFMKTYCSDVQKEQYVSYDPRLLNAPRAQTLTLDAPPFEGRVRLKDIYDSKYDDVAAKPYNSLRDINSGQIAYWIDKELAQPYFKPLFTIESEVQSQSFKDPMDRINPQYSRTPLTNNNRNISEDQETRDTIKFREDIMGTQLGQMNIASSVTRGSSANSWCTNAAGATFTCG